MKNVKREELELDISGGNTVVRERVQKRPNKRSPTLWYLFGVYSQFGIGIALPLVGCVLLGSYIDGHFGTKPTATVISLGLGFVFSVLHIVRSIKQFLSL